MNGVTPTGNSEEASDATYDSGAGIRQRASTQPQPTSSSTPVAFSGLASFEAPVGASQIQFKVKVPRSGHAEFPTLPIFLSSEHLEEVSELDARTSGTHQGVSVEDLRNILNHGFILGIRDPKNKLVGYATVITRRREYFGVNYVRDLTPQQWYIEGSASDPGFRGRGVGARLLAECVNLARSKGIQEIRASVRPENLPSLHRLLDNQHFEITEYKQDYFPGHDGERLVARLKVGAPVNEAQIKALCEEALTNRWNRSPATPITIPVQGGDAADPMARTMIRNALAGGFVGIGVRRLGAGQRAGAGQQSALVFVHSERLSRRDSTKEEA